ncbi:DNA polymerase III subunit alpha [Siminovitchia sp. 179-K 8D1 HS]|uniref:DNA polymerase III subunit alpha n=1 Tax=Siminovitchia sp. 179-K 8D1 HS TaxID=3142385 RepID=UPI0039A08066
MIELHNHTDRSNIRLLDSTNFVDELILTAAKLGKKGVCITDHECISAHPIADKYVKQFKKEEKIPSDFRLLYGNEIYLVNSLEEVRDNYKSGETKFPHFLLISKSKLGHECLRVLSSQAWSQSFYTGLMERTPTTKKQLEEVLQKYPNTLIGTSACLGSESSIHILNGDYDKARDFLRWCSNIFGKGNFFLELQPGADGEQKIVNEWLVKFSQELNLPLVLTSDTHYLRPEDAPIHEAFLNAKEGEREVASFYANTYLHTTEEIYEKLFYLNSEIIDEAMQNTLKIGDMCEDYSLENPTIIPRIELPEFKLKHLFEPGYEQYEYIKLISQSESEQDRYLLHLIEEGFIELIYSPEMSKEKFHEVLARINIELEEIWHISQELGQSMSSYYNTMQKIVSLMWADECGNDSLTEGSVVGVGRGSAAGFLICYLLKITMINPLEMGVEMPHWRHLHKSRGDISAIDIDVDQSPEKRAHTFQRMREEFGEDRVAQVATFGTTGSKSAIKTACRGLGIDLETANYIASLIPVSRGQNYSISDCLYGNEEEGRKKVPEFIREIEKYPRLREVAEKIEGLCDKRSIHAGGVLVGDESLLKTGAFMRAPNGTLITQYSLDDAQYCGNIKYDILGVNNISKIQKSMEIMLDEGLIEWQGTLRKTFTKYFSPDNMNLNKPEYYEWLSSGKIPDLFQFDTSVMTQALYKAKPSNLVEMATVNSLVRLMTEDGESPIDAFVKHKQNIDTWYEEMKKWGLNQEDIAIMEEHVQHIAGVAAEQETAMNLAMDERIAGLSVAGANRLRKSIAKKSPKAYESAKKEFYEGGKKLGTRKELLDYVWNVQIGRMRGYGFSVLHTISYSVVGLQNILICADYSPIIWYTACLTINSGSTEVEEGEKTKSTDYGKIATAIGDLKGYDVKVELPLINSANFDFTPDINNNRIIYSLKGIVGIGDDIVRTIITNRPYTSFEDFYERLYKTKLIQRQHILQLIKAGCFNEFDTPIEIMKQFLVKEVDVKDSLNGQNLSRVINLGLLDTPELNKFKEYYNFRNYIKKHVHQKVDKPKNRILILNESFAKEFFQNEFTDECIHDYLGNHILVDEKKFEKEYKEKMAPLMELLKDKDFVRRFNIAQFHELWNQHAQGTKESWEMDSVSFYSEKHELEDIDYKRYGISDFNELPEEPVVINEREWQGRIIKDYQLHTIVGTVIDKNKNSHTITVLTPTGIVLAKTYAGSFAHYDKQIKINGKIEEKSWWSRGNLVLMRGFRRGDQFVLKAPKGQHTVNLITEVRSDGSIGIQSERAKV